MKENKVISVTYYRAINEHVAVHCPNCGFNAGGYYRRDCTPSHRISFECRRDRVWDEKDQQMYKAGPCGQKWDIAVTQEAYEDWFFNTAKEIVLKKIMEKECE